MLRRFLADKGGNYMMMAAVATVPLMGGLGLAVDYSEMTRQRQEVFNALDAAGIATARHLTEVSDVEPEEIKEYARQFFLSNLRSVDAAKATLTVVLPEDNKAGGGTLQLSAEVGYQPYFMQTLTKLIRADASGDDFNFSAESEIRLKNTLEVALVLDNSGSMDDKGSGSGKKRIDLLKDAAKQLVDTLAQQAALMKQVEKPVQFALVPFAASVNVGSANAGKSWMDTDGISPVHHENFGNWASMSTGSKRVEQIGGIYYKKGSGWGDQEGQKVTRFSLFNDLQRIVQECVKTKKSGKCEEYRDTYASYASWGGCVEARPYPYNMTDEAPDKAKAATLFVPMFRPDETDNRDRSNRSADGNWWADGTSSSDNGTRQRYMPKYFVPAPSGTKAATGDAGPNGSCTTTPILPLTDVVSLDGRSTVKTAIDAMKPLGATNVPEGMAWGWRALSSGEPFTEGRRDGEKGNDKVLIVLTDGANTYYTPESLGYNDLADNKSTYSALGYAGKDYNGTGTSRIFMGTDITAAYDNDTYGSAMNAQFAKLCDNAKAKGIMVMTVSLDLSSSKTAESAQMAALKSCASDSRVRREPVNPSAPDGPQQPAKLYWNTTGGNLAQTFREIADELSNLRIVG